MNNFSSFNEPSKTRGRKLAKQAHLCKFLRGCKLLCDFFVKMLSGFTGGWYTDHMNKVEQITTKILNSVFGMLLFVISMAAFYLPYEIRIIPVVEQYLTPVRYVCAGLLFLALLFLYCSSLTLFRSNWALLAAIGFVAVLIFSTKMNGGDMESALGTYGLAGVFLLMDIAVFFKVNPKKYLLIAFFLLLLANVANTYTVYHYWGVGMWETYGVSRNTFYSLVGNYNGGIEYVMPMALCGSAYAHRYGKWLEILNYAAMLMSLIMAVKCDSMTQEIAFAGILAFMLVGDIAMIFKGFAKFARVICTPVILIAVDFVVFISVIVLNKSNWVASLGIDPDFHNRRHIWNMSMEWIQANPIWGSGQETVAVEASKITGYAHSHCTYLEIAYKTGFVGVVCLLLMLAAVIVALYRNHHDRVRYIMSGLLFVFGLAAIAETYPMVCVMLCLGLIYYIAKNTNDTAKVVEHVRTVDAPASSDHNKISETSSENPVEEKLSEIRSHLKEETDKMIEETKNEAEH